MEKLLLLLCLQLGTEISLERLRLCMSLPDSQADKLCTSGGSSCSRSGGAGLPALSPRRHF